MQRAILKRCQATLLHTMCLLILGSRVARAQGPSEVPNMVGHWGGLLMSSSNGPSAMPLSFDIYSQHERLAEGILTIGSTPVEIRVSLPDHGSRYFSGKLLSAQDFEAEQDYTLGHLKIKGTVFNLGDGKLGMTAGYTIGPGGKFIDQGSLITVQDLGGQDWKGVKPPELPTCWMGTYVLDGVTRSMTASFNTPLGSSITGEITVGAGVTVSFAGTISDTGLIWGITTLPGRGVTLITFTGQVQGGVLSGTLHYLMNDNSTKDATFLLLPCSFEDEA